MAGAWKAIAGLVLLGTTWAAGATDLAAHAAVPHHQLIACMTRQMSASRTISYNDAAKVCKAQLQMGTQGATLASSSGIKPAAALSP